MTHGKGKIAIIDTSDNGLEYDQLFIKDDSGASRRERNIQVSSGDSEF